MSELLVTISTGISAFVATNVDDLIVLTLLFSQINSTFRLKHIVFGHYLEFVTLVTASLPGFIGSSYLPQPLLGVVGLIPIAVAMNHFVSEKTSSLVFCRLLAHPTPCDRSNPDSL